MVSFIPGKSQPKTKSKWHRVPVKQCYNAQPETACIEQTDPSFPRLWCDSDPTAGVLLWLDHPNGGWKHKGAFLHHLGAFPQCSYLLFGSPLCSNDVDECLTLCVKVWPVMVAARWLAVSPRLSVLLGSLLRWWGVHSSSESLCLSLPGPSAFILLDRPLLMNAGVVEFNPRENRDSWGFSRCSYLCDPNTDAQNLPMANIAWWFLFMFL